MKDMLGRDRVMTAERALGLLLESLASRKTRVSKIGIERALGMVCAEPVIAAEDVPAFARSTVDGYAVRAEDTFGATETMPAYLNLSAEVFMGEQAAVTITDDIACKIPTGGMLACGCCHPWFNRLSMRQQFEEIRLADAVLEQFDGRSVHPFRPPHGRWTLGSLIACKRRSQRMVLWTHDSLDYRCSADEVVSHLRSRKIGKGDILLFHDDGPAAGQALELLVPDWQAAGFAFSALD